MCPLHQHCSWLVAASATWVNKRYQHKPHATALTAAPAQLAQKPGIAWPTRESSGIRCVFQRHSCQGCFIPYVWVGEQLLPQEVANSVVFEPDIELATCPHLGVRLVLHSCEDMARKHEPRVAVWLIHAGKKLPPACQCQGWACTRCCSRGLLLLQYSHFKQETVGRRQSG